MTIQIIWGTTPKRIDLQDAAKHPVLNEQEKFTAEYWLSPEQIKALETLAKKYDSITGFQIIRGALHGKFTRIRPIMENLGREYAHIYNELLHQIAKAIGWHHNRIDGANVVTLQSYDGSPTRDRWGKNNHLAHQKESAKKNWEAYHSYIGDNNTEWIEERWDPESWSRQD